MSIQGSNRMEEPSGKVAESKPVTVPLGRQAITPTGQMDQQGRNTSNDEALRQERLKRWQTVDDRKKIR